MRRRRGGHLRRLLRLAAQISSEFPVTGAKSRVEEGAVRAWEAVGRNQEAGCLAFFPGEARGTKDTQHCLENMYACVCLCVGRMWRSVRSVSSETLSGVYMCLWGVMVCMCVYLCLHLDLKDPVTPRSWALHLPFALLLVLEDPVWSTVASPASSAPCPRFISVLLYLS